MISKAMKQGGQLTTDWVANRYRIFQESGHTYIWEQDNAMQPGDLLNFWNWVHGLQWSWLLGGKMYKKPNNKERG